MSRMTEEQSAMLRALRHEGFAIVVFHPEEIGNANPRRVEDRLVELGNNDVIPALTDEEGN